MELPQVKKEHTQYRRPDGSVRIGGGLYGLAAEIRDPHGWVWAALALMNGQNSRVQIAERLRSEFPGRLSAELATALVDELVATGYVEDAAARPPAELSAAETARYARNEAFFSRVALRHDQSGWDAQLRLKNSRVLVLGVGGTGSHAAWSLAAAGVGRIHCVDDDLVEDSNLTRQALYREQDIGRPKAEVAAERLREVNPAATVSHERALVDSADRLAELLGGYDVLALCADEPTAEVLRAWTTEACVRTGVPWVGGGYNGPLVTVGVFAPEGPCFQCLAAGEEAQLDGELPPHLGGVGVIAPSAGISGHLVAYEVIALLTGLARTPPGYLRGINLIAPDHLVEVRHASRPDCATCHTSE
jgi:molybdopterin-synthase adenylyltransferase